VIKLTSKKFSQIYKKMQKKKELWIKRFSIYYPKLNKLKLKSLFYFLIESKF